MLYFVHKVVCTDGRSILLAIGPFFGLPIYMNGVGFWTSGLTSIPKSMPSYPSSPPETWKVWHLHSVSNSFTRFLIHDRLRQIDVSSNRSSQNIAATTVGYIQAFLIRNRYYNSAASRVLLTSLSQV